METEAAARRYFEAVAARDLEAMAACWKPGSTDRLIGQADLSVPEGLREWFDELFAAVPDFSLEPLSFTTEDDRCAVRWRATGTFTGPGRFQGLEPTGSLLDIEGCDVVRVQDGLIVHNDAYLDGATIARQLGVLPPAGSPLETRLTAAANARTRLVARASCAAPERIAEGVWLLRGGLFRAMNVYLLEEPDGSGVTAFDGGEKGMAPAILRAAAELGGLKRMVLGHADNDHRGAAPYVGVPVHCHPADVEAAEAGGPRGYWRMDELPLPVRLGHGWLMEHVWEGGPVKIAGTVSEGDEIAGFRVVEIPGHAPGLIALHRERDGVVLVSDAFYMSSLYGRPQPPAIPPDAYNFDSQQARASVRKLAELAPSLAAPGHLGPLTEDVPAELRRAAER